MTEPLTFPFPEIEGETPENRTRRLLVARPELQDHVAYGFWRDRTDHRSGPESRAIWNALSEDSRAAWTKDAMAACEIYWAASPAERKMIDSFAQHREAERNNTFLSRTGT